MSWKTELTSHTATYLGSGGYNLRWTLDTVTGVLNIKDSSDLKNYTSYSSAPWYSYSSPIKTVNIANNVTRMEDSAF